MPDKPIGDNNPRVYLFLFALVLLGGVALSYHHTLHSPFLLDDGPNIVQNPYIRIDSLSLESFKKVFSPYQPSSTRPLANLSFALNYIVGGYDPTGFHLVNILIHILTSFILFRLFFFYFSKTNFSENDSLKLAAFAALLWALNPLQTSAVTYIIQRMTSLSTLFFSASLLAYVHIRSLQLSAGKKPGKFKTAAFFLLSLVLWLLAMMSKEIAAILPVIILLHEFFFFKGLWSRDSAGTSKSVRWVVFVLPLLLYMGFLGAKFCPGILDGYASRDFTLGQRLLTEGRVVVRYMSLFLLPLPSRMTVCYDYPISSSLIDPLSTGLSISFLLVLIICSFAWAKKPYRLLSFGLLWTLSCLVIESTFVPLELIFEHRFYLPSIGFSLAIVALTSHLFNYLSRSKMVINVFWALLLSLMVAMTYVRNQDWRSELSIHLDGVEKAPKLVRAVNNLAGAYIRAKEYGKGQTTLERALQLDPNNVVVLSNLFMLFADLKMPVQADYYLKRTKQAVAEGHFRCNQSSNLLLASEVLFQNRCFADVIYLLESLKPCRDKNAIYYDNLALCYAKTGNHRKAIENFNKALVRDPANPYYRFSLIRSYMANRERRKALATLGKLRNSPLPNELKPHLDKLEKYLLRK